MPDTVQQLRRGRYSCAVDPRGATLLRLTHDGDDLVEPAPGGEDPAFRGALLAPWPNRLGDATYVFDGAQHRLPVTEPERGHALHGLVHGLGWNVVEATATLVTLQVELPTGPGWPFNLALRAGYELGPDGLTVRLEATNTGDRSLPYGCGFHPYLVCGDDGAVDDAELTLPAATRIETDDRMLPAGSAPVAEVDSDFRTPALIGDRFLDHCFTDLTSDEGGVGRVTLQRPGSRGVALSWGPWASWVQVHTAVRADPAEHRHGLAVEPMSCPPDAVRSGTGVGVRAPGAQHEAWWRFAATLEGMSATGAR